MQTNSRPDVLRALEAADVAALAREAAAEALAEILTPDQVGVSSRLRSARAQHRRAGITKNKDKGAPKSKRKAARAARKRNRK